jgi:glycogen operon protein
MVQRILGSPDLYQASGRKPTASVNFVTCHDGFTLTDLFAYEQKHNLENGEKNADGSDENLSWNCGVEGPTDDDAINELRLRCAKNAMTLLLVSQGVPMLNMGDEIGRSQRGNNNAYCHDTKWNWLDWDLAKKNANLLRFVRLLVSFRRGHSSLRRADWFTGEDCIGSGYPDISWHGVKSGEPDWGEHSHSLAFMICGQHDRALGGSGEFFYAAFNMHDEPLNFALPGLPAGWRWHLLADTAQPSPGDIHEPGAEPELAAQSAVVLPAKSCVLCLGREPV